MLDQQPAVARRRTVAKPRKLALTGEQGVWRAAFTPYYIVVASLRTAWNARNEAA